MAGRSFAGKAVVKAVKLYGLLALSAFAGGWGWSAYGLPATSPERFGMHFYQHVIGTLDGRSCPAYPVCSSYAQQALQKHGWLLGSWLALDRLIHEADDLQRQGPVVMIDGQMRLHDPLIRNDFWLMREVEYAQ